MNDRSTNAENLKAGDTVFFHCGGEVNLFAKVVSTNKSGMAFEIINGGYTLYIVQANPPANYDYNESMDWFKREYIDKEND